MKGTTVPTGRAMTVDTLHEASASGAKESELLVSGHVYGVFHGTGGLAAAVLAREVFGEKTMASLVELCAEANGRIAGLNRLMAEAMPGQAEEAPVSTTAAVVRFERDAFDWVLVGESHIVVVLPDGSFEALPAEGEKGAAAKGELAGQGGVEALMQSGRRKLAGVRHVLLFTGGLLHSNEERPKAAAAVVNTFIEEGLRGAYSAGGSRGDDVAAIAISFLPPNPARTSKKKAKVKKLSATKKSGVPSRRRKGPRPSSV